MKPLNLPKESQEALLNDAKVFLKQIDLSNNIHLLNYLADEYFNVNEKYTEILDDILALAPYQIGEEVYLKHNKKVTWDFVLWRDIKAEYMTEEDSDFKATIKDVKVVKVMDTEKTENYDDYSRFLHNILGLKRGAYSQVVFANWYNKQYGNYDENPYVFLYEIERS